MIILIATTRITAQTKDTFMELARVTVETSRAEDGCVSYDCSADLKDPLTFRSTEVWRDAAALDAHRSAAHHVQFMADLQDESKVERMPGPAPAYYEATPVSR